MKREEHILSVFIFPRQHMLTGPKRSHSGLLTENTIWITSVGACLTSKDPEREESNTEHSFRFYPLALKLHLLFKSCQKFIYEMIDLRCLNKNFDKV